jgi:predicted DNA-binding protein (MmcQ/YjbR family)
VRGKLFAQLDDHHHGADHLAVWLPAPLGEQEAMIFTDPERFFRPPYVGPRGWVGVRIDGKVDWSVVSALVAQAYRLVAPPRLREALEAAPPASGRSRKR